MHWYMTVVLLDEHIEPPQSGERIRFSQELVDRRKNILTPNT
jgi:hypothetical protein